MSFISPQAEATAYHIPQGKYDAPDKYLGDFTTTTENGLTVPTMMVVDTPGNAAWIHEGNTWTHRETKDRGRGLDRREYETLSSSIASMKTSNVAPWYLPSATELLNSKGRFQSKASAYLPESRHERDKPCVDDSKDEGGHRALWPTLNDQLFAHRGVLPSAATVAKYGEMPDLDKLIHAAALPDKSRGQIEDEIRTAQDRRSLLMHNQIGLSDYGVAQPGDHMRPYPAPRPVIRVSDVTQSTQSGMTIDQLYHNSVDHGDPLPGVTDPPAIIDPKVQTDDFTANGLFKTQAITDDFGNVTYQDQDSRLMKTFMAGNPVDTTARGYSVSNTIS